MYEFDLFVDESGDFTESSEGRGAAGRERPPSQLAGVLVRSNTLTEAKASDILDRCLYSSGIEITSEFHSNRVRAGKQFDQLVISLLEALETDGVQPIRISNSQQVDFASRVATYTHLLAELVVQAFRTLSRTPSVSPNSAIRIHVYYAVVFLGLDASGKPKFIEKPDYTARLDEHIAFARVRLGQTSRPHLWSVGAVKQLSAKVDTRIQLCDLVSNASYADCRKCGEDTARVLRSALSPYDYTLAELAGVGQARALLDGGQAGAALVSIVGSGASSKEDLDHASAREVTTEAVSFLSTLTAGARNAHLETVSSWLAQLIEVDRSLQLAQASIEWLQSIVVHGLRSHPEMVEGVETVLWFEHRLNVWLLTSYNHAGNLNEARVLACRLAMPSKDVVGRWEHLLQYFKGAVAIASHYIDSWEFAQASEQMRAASAFFESVTDLLDDVLPSSIPPMTVSDSWGEILGTLTRAEIGAGLGDADKLQSAHAISVKAETQFAGLKDQHRQYQYQSQIAMLSGDYQLARASLARCTRGGSDRYEALCDEVCRLSTSSPVEAGFLLLHTLRIASRACVSQDDDERMSVAAASTSLARGIRSWEATGIKEYPAHGVLRYGATVLATCISRDRGLALLSSLEMLCCKPYDIHVGKQLVYVAACAEMIIALWNSDQRHAKQLLRGRRKERNSLVHSLKLLRASCSDELTEIKSAVDDCIEELSVENSSAADTRDVLSVLRLLSAKVFY